MSLNQEIQNLQIQEYMVSRAYEFLTLDFKSQQPIIVQKILSTSTIKHFFLRIDGKRVQSKTKKLPCTSPL